MARESQKNQLSYPIADDVARESQKNQLSYPIADEIRTKK